MDLRCQYSLTATLLFCCAQLKNTTHFRPPAALLTLKDCASSFSLMFGVYAGLKYALLILNNHYNYY